MPMSSSHLPTGVFVWLGFGRRMEILRTEVKDLTYQFRKSCPEYHLQRESEERRQLLGDTPRSPLSVCRVCVVWHLLG